MKIFVNKEIGTLVHIYSFLNGGYFASNNQLFYYNEKAYQLYSNNKKDELLNIYNNLKIQIPNYVLSHIERSAGIRYFCCDGCHDAEIKFASYKNGVLSIELDLAGMLGCLNIKNNSCVVKIKTKSTEVADYLINDVEVFDNLIWLNNEISFDENNVYFDLEIQAFKNQTHENIKYQFIIEDISIE